MTNKYPHNFQNHHKYLYLFYPSQIPIIFSLFPPLIFPFSCYYFLIFGSHSQLHSLNSLPLFYVETNTHTHTLSSLSLFPGFLHQLNGGIYVKILGKSSLIPSSSFSLLSLSHLMFFPFIGVVFS